MKPCRDGQHTWQVIYRAGSELNEEVVRWCTYCGAVVIDEEMDGRLNPGVIEPIRFPQATLYLTKPIS